MKTEKEIRTEINKIIESNKHVLDCGPATLDVNSPRALMQLSAIVALDNLYFVLGKKRPRFVCDNAKKTNC